MPREVKRQIWLDSLLVVASFLLAFGAVSKHDSERRVSLPLGVFLVIAGTCFFVRVTQLLNKLMLCTSSGIKFVRRYNLSLSDCLDISNKYYYALSKLKFRSHYLGDRLVSALQSILSVAFGIFVCQYSCRRDFLTTSHIFSESYAW